MSGLSRIPNLKTLRTLPKVELHAHLNASITTDSFQKLLRHKGLNDDVSFLDCHNMDEAFNQAFRLLAECVTHKSDLKFLAKEAFRGFEDDNVKYLEIRSTPKNLEDISSFQYVDTIIEAIKEFQEESDMQIRYLLSINREKKPYHYRDLFEELERNNEWQEWIVGIDYCGSPWKREIVDYDKYLQKARDMGFSLAIHAAEVKEQIYETDQILSYKPERLGHFCNVTDDEMKRFRDMGGIVEVCPSSNMVTNNFDHISDHTISRMRELDLDVTICTDDILLFKNNLSEEIDLICNTFEYDYEFCKKMTIDAIEHSFLREKELK